MKPIAPPGATLAVIEQMMGRTMKEYDGPVIFGEDLMQIEVGEKVRVLNR